MSSKQSGADLGVPSWDEFNVEQEELDYEEGEGGREVQECGPNLPPGFGHDDSQEGPSSSSIVNDFTIPNDHDEEPDDPDPYSEHNPQDPSQSCPAEPMPSSSSQRYIGPEIPSQFLQNNKKNDTFHALPSINSTSDREVQKPSSSNQKVIRPSLPSEFFASEKDSEEGNGIPPDEPQNSAFLASRPISLTKNITLSLSSEFLPTISTSQGPISPKTKPKNLHVIGPFIPPEFLCDSTRSSDDGYMDEPSTSRAQSFKKHSPSNAKTQNAYNLDLPLDEEEEVCAPASPPPTQPTNGNKVKKNEEDEFVGPMPPTLDKTAEEERYLNRRLEFEILKAQGSGILKREEWMTELPQKLKQSYGLSAKSSFSRSTAGLSSSTSQNAWTTTPGSSKKVVKEADSTKRSINDKIQEERVSKLNEDRQESLLDVHRKKRKAEENAVSSSETVGGRRPFNRNTDMQARGLASLTGEDAKARLESLGSRFGNSSSKKFL